MHRCVNFDALAVTLLLLQFGLSFCYRVVHPQQQQYHGEGSPISYVYYSSNLEDPVHEQRIAQPIAAAVPVISSAQPLAPYYALYASQHHQQQPFKDNWLDEGSKQQQSEKESESGEHADHGFDQNQGSEAAEAEEHGSEEEEAEYEDKKDGVAGHEHEEAEHGAHEIVDEARDGGSKSGGSYHRKGERVTGYHKTYHKDEYKKNSEFYDEADEGGNFERHGSSDEAHATEEGRRVHSGNHEDGQEHANQARRGHKNVGRENYESRSHAAETGEDSHGREHREHGRRDGYRLQRLRDHRHQHPSGDDGFRLYR